MDWFSSWTIAYIKLIDMFKDEGENLSIWVDGGTVYGGAKVACVTLFEHGCFFELNLIFAFIKSLQV